MMIDIDKFKMVNDEFGHQTGDSVLKDMSQLIRRTIREVDTPARWGGEEFIVLCSQTRKEDAYHGAKRIMNAISDHEFKGVTGRDITVSVGIAGIPDGSINTSEKMIHDADLAMYDAKSQGRNRIVIAGQDIP